MKKHRIFWVLGSMCLVLTAQSFAGLIDWERRNRYLQEQQEAAQQAGKEIQLSTNLPYWMQVEPKVATEDEKKYDVNKDGTLSPVEMKVYLRRVYEDVQNGSGKSVSTSEALKEYDQNKDGVITKFESDKIKADVF